MAIRIRIHFQIGEKSLMQTIFTNAVKSNVIVNEFVKSTLNRIGGSIHSISQLSSDNDTHILRTSQREIKDIIHELKITGSKLDSIYSIYSIYAQLTSQNHNQYFGGKNMQHILKYLHKWKIKTNHEKKLAIVFTRRR